MTTKQYIAIAIAIVATLAFVGLAIVVFLWPEDTLKRFDTAWIRVLILVLCSLLSFLITIELYTLWYDPPAKRMTRYAMLFITSTGSATTITPFGLLGVHKVQGLGIEITAQEAGYATVACLAITFFALFMFHLIYVACCFAEEYQKQK